MRYVWGGMTLLHPRERLNRLVELASQSGLPARRALANDLADLLLDWPVAYPPAMREPFEALLEKAVRDVEPAARAILAERFTGDTGTPLAILNLLIFDAAPAIKTAILLRNALAMGLPPHVNRIVVDERALLAAVRGAIPAEVSAVIASRFDIAPATAAQILADGSGYMLGVLCKGARLARATCSALVVLAHPGASAKESYRRLAIYDAIPAEGCEALLDMWRSQATAAPAAAQAA